MDITLFSGNIQVTIERHPVRFFVYKRPHVDYFLSLVSVNCYVVCRAQNGDLSQAIFNPFLCTTKQSPV